MTNYPTNLSNSQWQYISNFSPLNYELPIIVSNENGNLVRWIPFHYDADRKTIHSTSIQRSEKKSNTAIKSWSSEFFIPYKLLRPLNNIYPQPGTV